MFDIMGLPNSEPSQLSSERLVRDRLNYDHEMLRLIFAHLRHQMQLTVDANVAIEQDATKFIINQVCIRTSNNDFPLSNQHCGYCDPEFIY